MKKAELYQKTVDILVQAYFDNTLVHGNCWACAVGNIVCANMGYRMKQNFLDRLIWVNRVNGRELSYPSKRGWAEVFCANRNGQDQREDRYSGVAKIQIDSTGYSWRELARVENAFENAFYGQSSEDWMFNGLMAVIDALDEIHGNADIVLTKSNKERFIKQIA